MIQRQSDSFVHSAHSSTPSSPHLPGAAGTTDLECKAKGRGSGMEDDEKSHNPLERDAHSTHECAHRRGSRANARDVLRPSYVRKLKS